jgi:hypothetical protein
MTSAAQLTLVNGSARWSDADQGIVISLRDSARKRTLTCVITIEALQALLEEGLDANDYIGATFRFRQRIAAIASEKLEAGTVDDAGGVIIGRVDIRTEAKAALDALRRLLVRTSPGAVSAQGLDPQSLAELRGFHERLVTAATANETALAKLDVVLQRAEAMWKGAGTRRHSAGFERLRNDAVRALDSVRQLLSHGPA